MKIFRKLFKKFHKFHKKEDDHWLIITVILLLCVTVLALALGQSLTKPAVTMANKLSAEQASKKLNDFLNQMYGQQIGTITIKQISEESGLYKILLTLTNQGKTNEDTVYLSQDGKFFIPGPQDINQILAQQNQQTQPTAPSTSPQNLPKQDTVKVEMFTMSYCPYGNQAEGGIIPVTKLLGKKIIIEPHYVIYENYQGGGVDYCLAKGKYCSMHGIAELNQDVREICLYKYQPTKFWDYLELVNKNCNVQNIETCWENEAKTLSINTSQIKTCLSKEAETLLAKEVELNKKYNVSGSPAVFINGTEYQGGRAPEDYKTAFCNGFKTAPQECSQKLGTTSSATTDGCGG
jgi:protein-disulfide isomerase